MPQAMLVAASAAGGRIGDIRGRGAMIAIELVKPGTTEPDPQAVSAVVAHCHDSGVLVITAGTYGNVLRFLPPLSISDELLNEAMDILGGGFATLR